MQGSTEVLVSRALAEDRHVLGLQRGEGGLPRGGLHLEVASTEEDAWPHQVIIAEGLERVEFDPRCAESDPWPACGDIYVCIVQCSVVCVYV